MISGPQTVEAPYFNASSRKGSVPHLTIGAKHHLPFANMDVARSRAMFDDITEWFSLGIGKSSSTWQCHAALGRAPVFNRERVHSQPPQMVIFVSVTSVRLHATTAGHGDGVSSIYLWQWWLACFCEEKIIIEKNRDNDNYNTI